MAEVKIKQVQTFMGINWQVRLSFLILWLCHSVSSQLHYSIAEELRKDSAIANIAKDLELDVEELTSRRLRIVSRVSEKYFSIDLQRGILYVKDRIDRETLCVSESTCFLTFDAMVENPLHVVTVDIEIQDINDNAPMFYHDLINLQITESTSPGTHLALQNAEDPDIGTNAIQTYRLSDNQYFTLREKVSTDGSKIPELVLEKPLDHETQRIHELILTASDGGNPVRSGTALIQIAVTDANDNLPIFTQEVYKVTISENIPINSTVLTVNATDRDEGTNAQITYSFSQTSGNNIHTSMFSINSTSGEIRTKHNFNFEVKKYYEISVQAKDGGGFVAHSKILIEVLDKNDNAPEISVISFSPLIPEDSPSGTLIALIEVQDQDSGENGEVDCQLLGTGPFQLHLSSNRYYRIVTTGSLDREAVPWYNITIQASDRGSPQLSNSKFIKLDISDVNDNAPVFTKSSYVAYIAENNLAGASIYRIQASDIDAGDNAKVIYSIYNTNTEDYSMSSFFSINIESGVLYAQRSFDYEQHKEFQIKVYAKDYGSPSLSCNASLTIRITDQNDNAPTILYPSSESVESFFEMVPVASEQGALITKIVAVDADSGHNSWLSYHVVQGSETSLFSINQHTGEIRTSRVFQDKNILKYKLVVMVKDNGVPSLSATVTLSLIVADHFQQVVPKLNNQLSDTDSPSNLQIYLVAALALISLLFILTVMLVVISKCKESNPSSTFGPISTNLYSHVDPMILSKYNNGTLSLPHSYNVCVAMDAYESDFTFIKPTENVPTDNLIDADDSGLGNDPSKDALSLSNAMQVSYSNILQYNKEGIQ